MQPQKKSFNIVKISIIFSILVMVVLVITTVALLVFKETPKEDVIDETSNNDNDGTITDIENDNNETTKLEIEEHTIIAQGEDTPDHVGFNDNISKEILNKRAEWRKEVINSSNLSSAEEDPYINSLNDKIGINNYYFDRNYSPPTDITNKAYYNLKYFDNIVAANLSFIRNFQERDHGTFSFSAEQTINNSTKKDITFYKGEILEWDANHLIDSIIYNDELLEVLKESKTSDESTQANSETETKAKYLIKTKKKVLYSFIPEIDYDVIQSFLDYENHWVLEYRHNETKNVVVSDGISIGKNNQYDNVFNYTLIKGKPFYFFEKDGKVKISYNDEILENEYEAVVHNKCCEATSFNPTSNGTMIWFYALKDGNWVYVEAGIYE